MSMRAWVISWISGVVWMCIAEETFVKIANSNYFIGTTQLPWKQAKVFCEKNQAYLTMIKSSEEHTFLTNVILSKDKRLPLSVNSACYWIGASDSDDEGNWRWIDGSSARFINWRDDDIHIVTQLFKDCAQICTPWDEIYVYSTEETCYVPWYPLCEVDGPEVTSTPVATVPGLPSTTQAPHKTGKPQARVSVIRRVAGGRNLYVPSKPGLVRNAPLITICYRMCVLELKTCAIINYRPTTDECHGFSTTDVLQNTDNVAGWEVWELTTMAAFRNL